MPTELVTVQSKCRELLGSQELVISSQAHLGRFNDYPLVGVRASAWKCGTPHRGEDIV